MGNILLIGATSAIAEATARLFARRGDTLYLTGRNEERLQAIAQDLRIRGASRIESRVLDVNHFEEHGPLIEDALRAMGTIDIALIAHGSLPDQKACEQDADLTLREINTNALTSISLLTFLANTLEKQDHGTIVVISSVAGDRGRQSNYVYGTAKGAISIFLQGLRNRLQKSGVHVLTIKPGFVDTPMTTEFDKGFLWVDPGDIALGIMKAIEKKKDVVYLPWFWRGIMLIIKAIPEVLFKRMKL